MPDPVAGDRLRMDPRGGTPGGPVPAPYPGVMWRLCFFFSPLDFFCFFPRLLSGQVRDASASVLRHSALKQWERSWGWTGAFPEKIKIFDALAVESQGRILW